MRLAGVALALLACGPRPSGADTRPTPQPGPAEPATTPLLPAASGTSAPAARAADTAPSPTPPPAFPPRQISPPHARSASLGDGEWTPLGDTAKGERAATTPPLTTPPLVVRTVLHPHPESRWITVTVAAVDLTRSRVRLVPGTEDLLWAKKKPGPESGLVPAAERPLLAIVMNGGFQPKHGRWGLVAGDVIVAPPKAGGCTIGLDADGGVTMGTWDALEPSQASFVDIRQTVPCLVEGGAVHPWLVSGRDTPWKGQVADLTTRRRSAIGVDASRRVLFYAMGEEASARWLAEGLLLAGAAAGAQLDINWYWTRFLLFGEDKAAGGALRVTSTLVPKMEHQSNGYVERPSTRDFFYVTTR